MSKAKKEEGKSLDRSFYMKPEKITPGAVRFCETTAGGTKKAAKSAHFRTLYVRHEALETDSDGELVVPARIKVTISEQ